MDDFLREDEPVHVCDRCDRDAVAERDGLYHCAEHPFDDLPRSIGLPLPCVVEPLAE